MSNPFRLPITAEDKTAAAFKSINKKVDALGASLGKATGKLAGGSNAFNIGGDLGDAAKSLMTARGAFAEAAGSAELANVGFGAVALGAGSISAALGLAVKEMIDAGNKFSDLGVNTFNVSRRMGASVRDVTSLGVALSKYGIDQSTATSALTGFGEAINDADFGRNNALKAFMNQTHLQFKRGADGALDYRQALLDVSAVVARQNNAQSAGLVARQFGLDALLPALQDGPQGLAAAIRKTAEANTAMTDQEISDARRWKSEIVDLDAQWRKMKQDLTEKFVIPWALPAIKGADYLTTHSVNDMWGDLFHALGLGGSKPSAPPAPAAPGVRYGANQTAGVKRVDRAGFQGFFQGAGWNQAQAAGLLANAEHESSLNPFARNGQHYGLFQWDKDRQAAFKAWAGHPMTDTKDPLAAGREQMAFANYELRQGNERNAGQKLDQAMTGANAAFVISELFERHGDPQESMRRAAEGARLDVNVQFKNAPPGTGVQTAGGPDVTTKIKIEHAFPDIPRS